MGNGKVGHYDQLDVYLAYDFKHARITLYADNVLNSRKDILTRWIVQFDVPADE